MASHVVSLRVIPCLRIECKFWLGDDGWNGSCEHPPIAVHAGSFEQAKAEMEVALAKHIESLLERSRPMHTGAGCLKVCLFVQIPRKMVVLRNSAVT